MEGEKDLEMVEGKLMPQEKAGKFPSTLSSVRQRSQCYTCSLLVYMLLTGHEEIALKYFLERFEILDRIQA